MRNKTVALGMCAASVLMFTPHLAFSATKAPTQPAYVELRASDFQKEIDGKKVDLYTIKNKNGMVVRITNYGARVEQVLVRDRNGKLADVAQG